MESSEHLEQLKAHYSIKEVVQTGKQVGHGAYGYVEEVEVSGALCAAKKVHRVLVHHQNLGVANFKQKFFSECVIMSKLRHPHVVQFLGVYFPSDEQIKSEEEKEQSIGSGSDPHGLCLPWLIMELLPMNLGSFLDKNRATPFTIPYSVKSSLLLDITKGLSYLHSQSPIIIHRDLTARNILINSALVAKIADFGVARITDPMGSVMSVGPGTIAYMPPEVHATGSGTHYFTSIDIFSFGVIVLYMITQECPLHLESATHPDPNNPQRLVAVSEVDRRKKYFAMANWILTNRSAPEFALLALSKSCLNNNATDRPIISELLQSLKELKERIPDQLLEKDKFKLMKLAAMGGGDTEADTAKTQQLGSRIRQLELDLQVSELTKQQFEEEHKILVTDKGRLEALLVQKEHEMTRIHVTLERRHQVELDEKDVSLHRMQELLGRLKQQLLVEKQTSEDRKQAVNLLEQRELDLQGQLQEALAHTATGGAPCTSNCKHVQQRSISQLQQLRSLLKQLMGDDVQGSTDSRGTLPRKSDNTNDTDGEENCCHTEESHDGPDNISEFIAPKSSIPVTLTSLQKTLQSTTAESIYLKNEKKFSIIVYGVSECPEGTSKPDQSSHDFGEVASFLLKVDSSIQPQSIKDMHRLGKYHHERPRPRPILVKFIRSADVSKVLAKRSLIQPPYSVKPYLSKEEQRCESALLKERWSLIQSGTSRESIKIRLKDGVIMVDSKLYGKWDSTTNTLIKQ